MKLTENSRESLYKKDNGFGVVFVKTSNKEFQEIQFNLGRNGKFYTMEGTELTKRLNALSSVIEEGYKNEK